MNLVRIPSAQTPCSRPLSFYLAAELWIATNMPPDDYMFTWVVAPTVICGRHQDIAAEVDLAYCREHDIAVVRRDSGGGCVYADTGNIMISHIAPTAGRAVADNFTAYTTMIIGRLERLGIKAEATGRNDITIAGRKISGGAFYRHGDRDIAHSTMLFDFDPRHMTRAITPSRAKLAAHGVKSVKARITTLSELYPELSFELLRRTLDTPDPGDTSLTLTPSQVAEIEALQIRYDDPARLTTITNQSDNM